MTDNIYQQKLRNIIRNQKRTELSVAVELGITKWTMSRKMHGEEDFTWSEAVMLCEILGIENPIGVIAARKERTRCP